MGNGITIGMSNQINQKYLVKKIRAVSKKNWKDQTDFERADDYNHPNGKTYYYTKRYDMYTPYLITVEQMMKDIVNYKENGYEIILLEK